MRIWYILTIPVLVMLISIGGIDYACHGLNSPWNTKDKITTERIEDKTNSKEHTHALITTNSSKPLESEKSLLLNQRLAQSYQSLEERLSNPKTYEKYNSRKESRDYFQTPTSENQYMQRRGRELSLWETFLISGNLANLKKQQCKAYKNGDNNLLKKISIRIESYSYYSNTKNGSVSIMKGLSSYMGNLIGSNPFMTIVTIWLAILTFILYTHVFTKFFLNIVRIPLDLIKWFFRGFSN